jgi:hypothetical protein
MEGKIIPNSLDIWHRGFLSLICLFAFDFSGLEAISSEVKFAVAPTAKKDALAREDSTYS